MWHEAASSECCTRNNSPSRAPWRDTRCKLCNCTGTTTLDGRATGHPGVVPTHSAVRDLHDMIGEPQRVASPRTVYIALVVGVRGVGGSVVCGSGVRGDLVKCGCPFARTGDVAKHMNSRARRVQNSANR